VLERLKHGQRRRGSQTQPGDQRPAALHSDDLRVRVPLGDLPAHRAQPIDQTQFQGPSAGPHLAGEQVLLISGQHAAAAGADPVAEHAVQFRLQAPQPLHVILLLGQERVEPGLVCPGGVQPSLDPEALQQPVQPETPADHPDRPHQGGGVGDDLIGGAGKPVTTGCGDVLAERQHRHALVLGETSDPVSQQRGLGGGSTRRVD
jgi:hypothetical protein